MKKIKIGVIGTGMAYDRLHLPALLELSDKYEIVALSNPSIEKLKKSADKIGLSYNHIYNDYKQMIEIEDIDVVDIAVPISQNYKVSNVVASMGKNIICEKPLASNIEDAVKFLSLQDTYSIRVLIAENYRYNEENKIIKEIIDSGKIGDIVYFIRNNMNDFKKDMIGDTFAAKDWRQHPDYEGGAFLDASVHDIAAFRYIFGDIRQVTGFGMPQEEDFCPYKSINSSLYFNSGVIGHYVYYPRGIEIQKPSVGLRIYGTKGSVYLEDKNCGIINIFYNDNTHEIVNYNPGRGYYNEFLNFYNSFYNTEDIEVTPWVEYGDTKIIFSILDAIKYNKVISIDNQYRYIVKTLKKKVYNKN